METTERADGIEGALAALEAGDDTTARTLLEHAAARDGDDALRAAFALAVMDADESIDAGAHQAAVERAETAATQLCDAIDDDDEIDAVLEALSSLHGSKIAHALALLDDTDLEGAARVLAEALDDESLTGVTRALVATELAEALLELGDARAAVDVTTREATKGEAGWPVAEVRVRALVEQGDIDGALAVAHDLAHSAADSELEQALAYAGLEAEVKVLTGDATTVDTLSNLLARAEQGLGDDHPLVGQLRHTLVTAAASLKRADVAVAVLEPLVEQAEQAGVDHLGLTVELAAARLGAGDATGALGELSGSWGQLVEALQTGETVGLDAAVVHVEATAAGDLEAGASEALTLWQWLDSNRAWDSPDADLARQLAVERLVAAGDLDTAVEVTSDAVQSWLSSGEDQSGVWWLGVLGDLVERGGGTTGRFELEEALAETAGMSSHPAVTRASRVAVAARLGDKDGEGAVSVAWAQLERVTADGGDETSARRELSIALAACGRDDELVVLLNFVTDCEHCSMEAAALELPVWEAAMGRLARDDEVEAVKDRWRDTVNGARADEEGAGAVRHLVGEPLDN
jgi:tetratricopeptide (TPR) repeat protein